MHARARRLKREREAAICSMPGCDRPVRYIRKQWCAMHYLRWRHYGDPSYRKVLREAELTARFWQKVEMTGECWLWKGGKDPAGYPTFSSANRRAHRYAYELLVGPIPRGYHLHHHCLVKHCVNPAHLEAVTPAEHARRERQAKKCSVLIV